MNLLLAAPISKGETSTSIPSCRTLPKDLLPWVSCEGGVGVGIGAETVSSTGPWGLGGQIIAEPGLGVIDGLVWSPTQDLGGTGEDVLPSLSLPLLTSLPALTRVLRILL